MRDPYRILGVRSDSDQATLRRAFHRLAKLYHPDLHPGDASIEQRFKEISAAYSLIADPDRRARYDRGEAERSEPWTPAETARPFDREFFREDAEWFEAAAPELEPEGETEDWFSRIGRPRPAHAPSRMRGADVTHLVRIGFAEAARGGRKLLRFGDGTRIEFNVPPGTNDRDIVKLDGQGRPGVGGAPAGDAFLDLRVAEHPRMRRDGYDILVDVPLTPEQFRAGARVIIPTLDGDRPLNVPPDREPDTEIRLESAGIVDPFKHRRGDLVIRLIYAPASQAAASR
ncbi:MAG: DnaJ C-terminal domain-containing protein [Dongiaceae bacterium]